MDLTLIETMPLGEIGADRTDQYLPLALVRARLEQRWTLEDIPDTTGGPARYVRVAETGGRLGFITPLTHNFCEGCNRVRVTCTGTLYMCLGQEDAADLRAPLRASEGDELLHAAIDEAIGRKPKGHDFVIDRAHRKPRRLPPHERHRRLRRAGRDPLRNARFALWKGDCGHAMVGCPYSFVPCEGWSWSRTKDGRSTSTYGGAGLAGLNPFRSPRALPLCRRTSATWPASSPRGSGSPARPTARRARRAHAGLVGFVLGFSTVFVALGRRRLDIGAFLRGLINVCCHPRPAWSSSWACTSSACSASRAQPRGARTGTQPGGRAGRRVCHGAAFAFGWTPCIGPVLARSCGRRDRGRR